MSITFLTGAAGTGKTTYGLERLRELLTSHIPAHNILVLVPQQTLADPYRQLLRDPHLPGSSTVEISTLNGLALRTIDLFWPLIAGPAGFQHPQRTPIFLSIETAQYYLKQAIEPLLTQGYFDPNVVPITISIPRLMSQILDNLNKAALIGLPHTKVGERLLASLPLEPTNRLALEHTQVCVNRFREFCLARNLLDFSLRIETFYQHLWPIEGIRQFLTNRYRHLIIDNLEEDTPFTHSILQEWLPKTESALLINDEDAGYRIFLGANWRTAQKLQDLADKTIHMTQSWVAPAEMLQFGKQVDLILNGSGANRQIGDSKMVDTEISAQKWGKSDPRNAIIFEQKRFYPQTIDWTIQQINRLLQKGVLPNEIVVLAPFVSDALRFSFIEGMKRRGLPARSHRPSRPLREESAAKTLLTLVRLAFPQWEMLPNPFDVAQALQHAIVALDPIRANLLTRIIYRQDHLTAFDQIEGPIRDRITYQAGLQFDHLRTWLQTFQENSEPAPVLDHFFQRLFDEVLAQPDFGFHHHPEAGEVVANLIDSARKFRRVAEQVPLHPNSTATPTIEAINQAYLDMIEQGIMAAQYIRSWQPASEESVLITPATTFLMSNRPVSYQFWLDAGSSGWWERIAQPLTHPYILAVDWEQGRPWTDQDEITTQKDRLGRLVLGLTRRCRKKIFIVNSEIGEQGFEQRGQLLMALQQMLRRLT